MSSPPEQQAVDQRFPANLREAHEYLAEGRATWPTESNAHEATQRFALRHAFHHRLQVDPTWAHELLKDLSYLRACVANGHQLRLRDDLLKTDDELAEMLARFFDEQSSRIATGEEAFSDLLFHGLRVAGWTEARIQEELGLLAHLRFQSRVETTSPRDRRPLESQLVGAQFPTGDFDGGLFYWSRLGHSRSGAVTAFLPDLEITVAAAIQDWRFFGSRDGAIAGLSAFASSPDTSPRWLLGHDGPVLGLAAAPQSNELWSWGRDGTVRRWGIESGRQRQAFGGHTDEITGCVVSNDESRLVTSSLDGSLRAWNLRDTQSPVFVGEDNDGSLQDVAVTRNGELAFVASRDGSIRAWNLVTKQPAPPWKGHEAAVNGLSLSADGRLLLTWSTDRTARVWQVDTGEPYRALEHESEVTHGRWLPEGRLLTADVDGRLWLWRIGSRSLMRRYFGHRGRLRTLDVDRSGRHVVTCGSDRTVRVWDLEKGAMIEHHGARLPGSRTLFAVAPQFAASHFDSKGFAFTEKTEEPPGWVQVVGRRVHRYVLEGGKSRATRSKQVLEGDWHRLSADGRRLLVVGHGVLTCHGLPTDVRERALPGWSHKPRIPVVGAELSPGIQRSQSSVISWDREHTIVVHEPGRGRPTHTLSGHTRAITAAAVDDGGRAVTASADGVCRVWDLDNGEAVLVRTESSGEAVLGITLRAGEELVTSWTRSSVARWSATTGTTVERHALPSCPTRVRRANSSEWMAAGTVEGQICWIGIGHDVSTPAHPDPVADLVVSADDRWVAIGSEGGDISIWETQTRSRIGSAWVDSAVRHLAVIGEHLAVEDAAGVVTLFEIDWPERAQVVNLIYPKQASEVADVVRAHLVGLELEVREGDDRLESSDAAILLLAFGGRGTRRATVKAVQLEERTGKPRLVPVTARTPEGPHGKQLDFDARLPTDRLISMMDPEQDAESLALIARALGLPSRD